MSNQPARTTLEAKRRGQAVAGALAGLVVVLVLVGVFIGVKVGGSGKSDAAAAHPAPSASQPAEVPSAEPSAEPSQAPAADVSTPPALSKAPTVKAGKGKLTKVAVTALVKGTGPVVKKGQTLTANYIVISYQTGKVIDSSWQTGQKFDLPIGVGQVAIKGFDDAIPGQRLGSRLQIDVPAAQATSVGQGDLRFVVDLLAAQ
jgi:peptidylprolyl isomerase